MYHIVFADDTGCLKRMVNKIASHNQLEIFRVEVSESETFGDMVEIVMVNNDVETWRTLLSEFQVLTSGRLTLD
jgi:positive regulator of sigma E activity